MTAAGDLANTLVYNPFQIAAYLQELQKHQAAKQEDRLLGEPTGSGHGFIALQTSCHKHRFVRELCSDPLCTKCEPVRAFERRRRWYPVLKSMRSPRLITLTIPDGVDLQERIRFLQLAFRRFLHRRLGSYNRVVLTQKALSFAADHYGELERSGKMPAGLAAGKVEAWQLSIGKFWKDLERRKDKTGKCPRLRHLIGKGFASLEITFGGDWHVHRHLCVDGQFIPWPLLCAAWQLATNDQATITDIREIDKSLEGMKEVSKYLSKPWEIPLDYQDEFIRAVHGLKRIWPLGGAKPVEPDKTCPFCNHPDCKCHIQGLANLVESGSLWGYAYKIFELDQLTSREKTRFVVILRPDGVWDEVPLLDTLSVCAPGVSRSGP